MDREGAAEPTLTHAMAENGEVGGMEHAVAEPRQQRQGQQHPIGGDQARQSRAEREGDETAEQQPLRTEAIDEDARRRLPDPGRHEEQGDDEAELGVAHLELGMKNSKEGWQGELHDMAAIMRRTHQRDNPAVTILLRRCGR